MQFPIIEAHPYPTSAYLSGDEFIKEVEKGTVVIE